MFKKLLVGIMSACLLFSGCGSGESPEFNDTSKLVVSKDKTHFNFKKEDFEKFLNENCSDRITQKEFTEIKETQFGMPFKENALVVIYTNDDGYITKIAVGNPEYKKGTAEAVGYFMPFITKITNFTMDDINKVFEDFKNYSGLGPDVEIQYGTMEKDNIKITLSSGNTEEDTSTYFTVNPPVEDNQ